MIRARIGDDLMSLSLKQPLFLGEDDVFSPGLSIEVVNE